MLWNWVALRPAVLRLDQVEGIAADVARFAPRLEAEDEVGWVHLLLRAADYLAWHSQRGFDALCAECMKK